MSKPWIALLALMLLFKNNLIDAANLRVRHKLPTKAPFWYKNFPPWWINPGALKAEASNYVNDMETANPIPPKQKNPLAPDKSQSLYEGCRVCISTIRYINLKLVWYFRFV